MSQDELIRDQYSLLFNDKVLGLIKPIYKKFKKGKRYVYKDVGIK